MCNFHVVGIQWPTLRFIIFLLPELLFPAMHLSRNSSPSLAFGAIVFRAEVVLEILSCGVWLESVHDVVKVIIIIIDPLLLLDANFVL